MNNGQLVFGCFSVELCTARNQIATSAGFLAMPRVVCFLSGHREYEVRARGDLISSFYFHYCSFNE